MVCCNLCIATDGLKDDLRVSSVDELKSKTRELFLSYNQETHIDDMRRLIDYTINQEQFAHLVGKMKLYNHLNKIKEIDFSNNTFLEYIQCRDNFLSNLNTSNLISLIDLLCSNNQLETLDLSNNLQLLAFDCSHNLLKNLDITQNIDLLDFYCNNNLISSLDLNENEFLNLLLYNH